MNSPALLPLPYVADSLSYFHTIAAKLPMALILQSDSPALDYPEARGRFDILTADPEYWLESRRGKTNWHGDSPTDFSLSCLTGLDALHKLVDQIESQPIDYTKCTAEEIPFCGGLIGYCSYDLASEFIQFKRHSTQDIDIPDMQFGFYSWACIQDHKRKKSWLVVHPSCREDLRALLPEIVNTTLQHEEAQEKATEHRKIQSSINRSEYRKKFKKIMDYILDGDCYQVNFSQRFSTPCKVKAYRLYQALRNTMPSPYCALMPILSKSNIAGEHAGAIISLSPERFLQMNQQRLVSTQPIKGTAARQDNPQSDIEAAQRLQNDKKNLSENLMIVDLLRNDLGKVCQTGSIRVKKLFELQSFSNVHHLVSTIEGQLKDQLNGADLFKSCFPGGSITGAPKIRAMQIIDELEPFHRSIYCGSIAYFSSHGTMDSSILIRTVLLHKEMAYCWGGGGIVSDSESHMEFQESLTKIKVILDCLKTM